MRYLPLLLTIILLLTSCAKPPEKMSMSAFTTLLRNKQIGKVVIVNEKQVEFTIKNSKEYPMGKWYALPPDTDMKGFVKEMETGQAGIAETDRIVPVHETRIQFLRDAFNYLLPLLVLAGMVAGFFALRRNRS